jgi:hypothetical protein
METQQTQTASPLTGNASQQSVRQLTTLLQNALPHLDMQLAVDTTGFKSRRTGVRGKGGITSVHGELHNDCIISLDFELLRCPPAARLRLSMLQNLISELDEKCRLSRPRREPDDGQSSLWVSVEVAAEPMSMTRQDALMGEVEKLNAIARALQAVYPWKLRDAPQNEKLRAWAGDTHRFLQGGASVALVKETLGGLGQEKRAGRSPEVQGRFSGRLAGPELLDTLQDRLLGQDRALGELAQKLRMECLTRPPHQPLRYCAQGTPGTGKSESAVLLAEHLEVPYANIDAASMPDYYTASAQLLGSGRGIVGSYKSGRLEQAAKHHRGAVLEISDLDHARPAVRSCLADLFLQILETGEGQTATVAMFSCANLILAFTINLPEGKDEQIHKPLGFAGAASHGQAAAQVNTEIKRMLSSAFLSRIGRPILFDPLDNAVLGRIVERTVVEAARRAISNLETIEARVDTEEGLGRSVVGHLDSDLRAFGARGVVERARSLTTEALLRARQAGRLAQAQTLTVHAEEDGTLHIEPE